MAIVWYILIHVSLGLIGYEVFTFTNLGAIYCAAAAAVVQGYAVYEIHRLAKPRFDAAFVGTPGSEKHKAQMREYWKRLGRVFIFRVSIFTILTLIISALMRGAGV